VLCNLKQLDAVKHKCAGRYREGSKIITVNFAKKTFYRKAWSVSARICALHFRSCVWLSLCVLLCTVPALAQSQQPTTVPGTEGGRADPPGTAALSGEQQRDQQSTGDISGTVVDQTGAVVAGAHVKLTSRDQFSNHETLSGENGQFSFSNVAPGSFQISITLSGFATKTYSAILAAGEFYIVPQVALAVATEVTEVRVGLPPEELAEVQVKAEEKQRVLGFIPNFYVSYVPDAAPLTSKQKYELAWKSTVDPVTFVLTGASAGVEQALNQFGGYGQGAQGYGKRYGAAYADLVTSTFIGQAILPSLLKQDPRYFYKGTGSTRSRVLYAIANSVICKGDNRRWQANYSAILGSLASGGISNAYYPPNDRGAGLTFENTLIGIGATAASNLLEEFVIPKLTPNLPMHRAAAMP
jgi:hypothetical protein